MAASPITVNLKLHPKVYQRLHEMGKPRGYTPTAYAHLLFDAGFAARVGQVRGDPVSDAELDEQVRLVFACAGQGDTTAIARATGLPEARVVKILNAWREAGRAGRSK